MSDILTLTTPLYAIIALGYIFVKSGFINASFIDALGQFTIRISLPVLVFLAISTAGKGAVLNIPAMAGYLLSTLPLMLVGRWLLHRSFGFGPRQSWSLSLGVANPNSVMIGLPLSTIVFPDHAAIVFSSFMLIENVILIPLTLIGADVAGSKPKGMGKTIREIGKSLLSNPILLAVLLALAARGTDLGPQGTALKTLRILAQTGPGLALFYIGATVAKFSLSGSPAAISTITFAKLIVQPLLAMLIFPIFVSDPRLLATCILFTAIPMLTIYPLFARRTDSQSVAATALLVATTLSFPTVTYVLYLLQS